MEITCAQMDVLISFYIEGDLSNALKTKVEEHLQTCSACRSKYNIIKGMLDDLKSGFDKKEELCPPPYGLAPSLTLPRGDTTVRDKLNKKSA